MKKKVILHVGYPKTASTTLQNNLFYKLYRDGEIGYLGKTEKKGDRESIYYPMLNERSSILSLDNHDFISNFNSIKEKISDLINNQINDVVILSDEVLIETRYSYKIYKDTFVTAERIKKVFSGHDVEVIILLRNQKTIIYSFYVEAYAVHENLLYLNSFTKYLNYGLENKHNSELAMYYYDKVVDYYCSLFGRNNVYILLFEEFIEDKGSFLEKLSRIIKVDPQRVLDLLRSNQRNVKEKDINGYYTNEKVVVRRLGEYLFYNMLRNKIMQQVKERFHDHSPIIKFFWKKLIMQQLRYKKNLRPTHLPKPSEEQLQLISEEFKAGNKKLVKKYGLELGKYGYPV